MAELLESLPAAPILRTFVQYLISFCSQQEVAADVIPSSFVRFVVLDECVKFGDPHLKRFREIRPKAIGGGILDSF